ncbi:MAG TPA: response regulator transcription factor [Rhizomicrobium sp.]|jgi:DNA-binding NarL/FixJ family response regulator
MRVLIADDHPLYREAAGLQIRRIYHEAVVQEVASLAELRAATVQAPAFDLILVDYHMPGMSADALAALVKEFPDIPLAVISGVAGNADVLAAARAGVRGYIPKTSTSEYFARALQLLLTGGTSIPTEVLMDQSAAHKAPSWLAKMSAREKEVLHGVAMGRSNKEIGRTLGLAEVTIKLHLRNVFRKMAVKSRSEAAVKAVKAGLG